VFHSGEFRMSPRPGRIPTVTVPRLAGLVLETAGHPGTVARLFTPLGLNVAVLDDTAAELRLDSGGVVQLRQGTSPTRIGLGFTVPDICAMARALDEQRIGWTVPGPNTIRVDRDGMTVDVTEGKPGLTDVMLYVSDVAGSARFWRTLGLEVGDATPAAADADPTDPAEPAADVELDGVTLRVRGCGVRPVTLAHMVIRVADPLGCCVGLDFAAWDYRRDGAALVTRTPDGCGVRLVPPLRG